MALSSYEDALRRAVSLTYLAVTDVTDGHAADGVKDGRALRADGRDILILAVSDSFEGMPLLDRQRKINEVLSGDLSSGILHSLRMKCWTRAQWDHQGRPKAFPTSTSTQCAGPSYSPVSVMLLEPGRASTGSLLQLPPSAAPAKKQPEHLLVCDGETCLMK